MVTIAWIAGELVGGFGWAGVLQPARNSNMINEIRPHWVRRLVKYLNLPIDRLCLDIKFHAFITVKKE
jgi:hypothetical protein